MAKKYCDKFILDDNGNPIPCEDLYEWVSWYENADRCVAETDIPQWNLLVRFGNFMVHSHLWKKNRFEPISISTVFLGLNHNFGDGEPLLFETMIFGGKRDGYQERYATRQESIKGHKKAVKLVANET